MVREETDFNAIRENLQTEIEKQEQRLARLKRAYGALAPEDEANLRAGKYTRMRVWQAVRDYLRTVGKASVTDILNELENGGADLGKYPLRTVRIAISSPYMADTFHVEAVGNDDVVSLKKGGSSERGPTADRTPPGPSPGKKRQRKR